MRAYQRALASYGAVQVSTGIAGANSAQLILMLFDGFLDSLAVARGHIERGAIREKSEQLQRAGRIIIGLQGALDFERGGELARNLDDLYAYVSRRLIHCNAFNDLDVLDEVSRLIRDIRDAWKTLPALNGSAPRLVSTN